MFGLEVVHPFNIYLIESAYMLRWPHYMSSFYYFTAEQSNVFAVSRQMDINQHKQNIFINRQELSNDWLNCQQKCNNFGYLSIEVRSKGNDTMQLSEIRIIIYWASGLKNWPCGLLFFRPSGFGLTYQPAQSSVQINNKMTHRVQIADDLHTRQKFLT